MHIRNLVKYWQLRCQGWETFNDRWIHPSGFNRYPRTTEEALQIGDPAKNIKLAWEMPFSGKRRNTRDGRTDL